MQWVVDRHVSAFLLQTVQRMFCVKFTAGSTILQQNAQPTASDCMYYLQEGMTEVVIMGTIDAASKQSKLLQCACSKRCI